MGRLEVPGEWEQYLFLTSKKEELINHKTFTIKSINWKGGMINFLWSLFKYYLACKAVRR